ncbi:acetyl-CoA carboxylase biotin carboxyl carrier protein [bacterium]|nr:acetyl-CoA carboxylase biotin carboxyl carrier protein [bacterium]
MFELDYIKELAKVINENSLTEISLEDGEKLLTIRKEKEIVTATQTVTAPVQQTVQAPTQVEAPVAETVKKGTPIKSPIVGTFYRKPSADSEAFVEVGKSVNSGDVVCIIEAMKLMNEIQSEVSGKITEICVDDGETVEYGQVLMYVE